MKNILSLNWRRKAVEWKAAEAQEEENENENEKESWIDNLLSGYCEAVTVSNLSSPSFHLTWDNLMPFVHLLLRRRESENTREDNATLPQCFLIIAPARLKLSCSFVIVSSFTPHSTSSLKFEQKLFADFSCNSLTVIYDLCIAYVCFPALHVSVKNGNERHLKVSLTRTPFVEFPSFSSSN